MLKKLNNFNTDKLDRFDTIISTFLLIIISLILPILLIVIVKFTGYSEIVEEIAKAFVVLFLILKLRNNKTKILEAILFGFLFGLSENFFYLNQIIQLGDMNVFLQRFIWTIPMHIITILIITLSGMTKKWFIIFGLLFAIIIHILFNGAAASFLIGS